MTKVGGNRTESELLEATDQLANEIEAAISALPGLTVTEAARRAGVSRATAHRYPAFLEHLEVRQGASTLVTRADVSRAVAKARSEVRELREQLKKYANHIQALTLELEDARSKFGKVIPLKGSAEPK